MKISTCEKSKIKIRVYMHLNPCR